MDNLQINSSATEPQSDDQASRAKLKDDFLKAELGFTVVVQEMLDAFKKNPNCGLIGHNMIYDVIYFYNQFIGPLPDTYEQFIEEWYHDFPATYDTKILSFKADYFGKTILGKVFEKCENDKRLKDVLKFQFDLKNGFTSYEGEEALSRCHEAAYDAYMTGYAFAKIVKYKQIDEIFLKNR